jgi:hypothetical protein
MTMSIVQLCPFRAGKSTIPTSKLMNSKKPIYYWTGMNPAIFFLLLQMENVLYYEISSGVRRGTSVSCVSLQQSPPTSPLLGLI